MQRAASVPEPRATGQFGTFAAAGDSFRDTNFSIYWVSNALFFVGQGVVLLGA